MSLAWAGRRVFSRRDFLAALPAAFPAAAQETRRAQVSRPFGYADPSTEFPVLRLTDPAVTCLLPANYGRPVARRGSFLLISSDASGRMQAHRLDYRSGEVRQLTGAERLEPGSPTLYADDRSIAFTDGARFLVGSSGGMRTREVYRAANGFELAPGLGVSEDGLFAALIERKDARYALRLVRLSDGSATTLAESDEEMRDPIPRPRRASVLYRRGAGVWLANYDARQNYRLKTAEGEIAAALWSPDGRAVLYLSIPADRRKLNNIREFIPDTNEDQAVAETSQFVTFARNADASVFVGASGSKASPHVLLLVRAVKRELTLAEHRSSAPHLVAPVFAPNSQRVFFTTDRDGKPAVYTMRIERLVEETAEPTAK